MEEKEGLNQEAGATSTETEAVGNLLTTEQVKKMIQSETDRVRTEYSQKLKELEKAKMTEDEKRIAELQEKEQALTAKEQELLKKSLTLHAINVLNEKKIPVEFAEYLIAGDEETTNQRIESFNKQWSEKFTEAVQDINKSIGRKPTEGNKTEKYTIDELKTMSAEQVSKIPEEELYRILRGG